MNKGVSTKADPGATGWALRDAVTRLRRRGEERAFDLGGIGRLIAGTSEDCALKFTDGEGVSRQHASFERQGDDVVVTDLQSTNGTRQDGEDRPSFVLSPGMELELGRAKLVAESVSSTSLWELLRRLVSWNPQKLPQVDDALQSVRQMANLRSCLVIHGPGSMVGTTRRLHRMVLGEDRPLSVHNRRETGLVALDRARDGMLLLDAENLPSDLPLVLLSHRLPDWRTRLVVGAASEKAAAQVAARIPSVTSFAVGPLADREDELERLLLAYADDAVQAFHASETALRPHDIKWIREHGVENLDDMDELMSRVVAVRNWGVTGGATKVGLTHGALSKYLRRRKIPT